MSQQDDDQPPLPAPRPLSVAGTSDGDRSRAGSRRDRAQRASEDLTTAVALLAKDHGAADGVRRLVISTARFAPRQAVEVLEALLEIDPGDATMWKILSSVSRHLGELERPLHAARRAVELSPDDPECWYVLGRAREETGDLAAASDAYGSALRLRPSYGKALDRSQTLLAQTADTDAAVDRALVAWEVGSLDTEPPPHEDRFLEVASRLKRAVSKSALAAALADTAATAGRGTRKHLICDCLGIALGEPCPPGIASGEFASSWEWAVPALQRLDYLLAKQPAAADLLAALQAAHRFAPLGDGSLLLRLDRANESSEQVALAAAKLLALRQPIVSNFCRAADVARRLGDSELLEWACVRFLLVYGDDITLWPLTLDYLEFSSCGALCVYLARRAGLQHDPHAALRWNLAGIDLLEKAIQLHHRGTDWHSSIRLATTCGETLWHSGRELGDVEVTRIYELGKSIATRLTAKGSKVYEATRDLARMNAGLARRLLAKGGPQEDIDRHVERATSSFRKCEELVRGNDRLSTSAKRAGIAARHQAFLVEMLPSPAAQRALAALPRKSMLTEARERFHLGKRREAIKSLLATLETTTHAPPVVDLVACGLLAAELLAAAGADNLRERFREAIRQRRLVGLFVQTASAAVTEARSATTLEEKLKQVERGRQSLEIAELASPASVQLLHLRVRIEETAGTPSTEVMPLLIAPLRANTRSFLENSYLLDRLLHHLDAVDPDLTADEEAAILRAVESGSDPILAQRALAWQLRRAGSTRWVSQYLRARRRFPQDPILTRLLVQSFTRSGDDKGSEIVGLLLAEATRDAVLLGDMEQVALTLPLGFYQRLAELAQEPQLQRAFEAASSFFWGALARGLAGALVNAPLEPSSLHPLLSLTGLVPPAHRVLWWTELLGSGRRALVARTLAECERILAEHRNSLNQERDPGRWKGLMEEFLSRHAATPEGPGFLEEGLDDLVSFCLSAASRYRPDDHDPTYWKRLQEQVRVAYRAITADHREHSFAAAWLRLARELAAQTQRQLLTSMKAPLHQLKNSWDHELRADSRRRRALPDAWRPGTNAVFGRALHYVRAHRWPRVAAVDLRTVLEQAVYEPPSPFVAVHSVRQLPRVWALTPCEPLRVAADAELLREVLWELLVNAREAVRHAGKHGWVLARLRPVGLSAKLVVEDSGAENEPSDATLLRLNSPGVGPVPSKDRPGFGVAFCHRVVAAHAGTLVYQRSSSSATGLRVELTLPTAGPGEATL